MRKIANKNKHMLHIEERKGEDIEEILRKLFVDEDKSIQEIQDELNITYVTVLRWLKKANITSRMLNI